MMALAGWLIAAVVADPSAAPVAVTGTSTCPSAAEVAALLPGLIGPKDPELPVDRATLSDNGSSVVVALQRASGESVGEKALDAALSCEQRARAAAVVIAAWESRLGVQAPPLVVQPSAGPPRPAPAAERPAAVVARSPAPEPPVSRTPPATRRAIRVQPGVSLGAAINGTKPTPAATVDVAFPWHDGVLVPAIAGLIVGSHSVRVSVGDGQWRRYGLLATVGSRARWSATWAEARIGVAATLLDISGTSFPISRSALTFDPGIPIGARFGLRAGPMRWWIDATAVFWPRPQTIYVTGSVPGSATLPRGEALLGLGASYEGR